MIRRLVLLTCLVAMAIGGVNLIAGNRALASFSDEDVLRTTDCVVSGTDSAGNMHYERWSCWSMGSNDLAECASDCISYALGFGGRVTVTLSQR